VKVFQYAYAFLHPRLHLLAKNGDEVVIKEEDYLAREKEESWVVHFKR